MDNRELLSKYEELGVLADSLKKSQQELSSQYDIYSKELINAYEDAVKKFGIVTDEIINVCQKKEDDLDIKMKELNKKTDDLQKMLQKADSVISSISLVWGKMEDIEQKISHLGVLENIDSDTELSEIEEDDYLEEMSEICATIKELYEWNDEELPFFVQRQGWTKDFYFEVERIDSEYAYGTTYKGEKKYRKNTKYPVNKAEYIIIE